MSPVIYTLDIETAPILAHVWGLFDQNIGLEQVVTDWSLLSFAAKRLDRKAVVYHDNRGHKDVRNDQGLMLGLWGVLNEADIVVAQNGKKFDIKKINARFIQLGFSPPAAYRVIDTLLEARKTFGFTSNKLAHLSSCLTTNKKSEHKSFPGFSLWTECLKDNPKAWNEMKKYNIRDVVATEELYLKLRPWMPSHLNVAGFSLLDTTRCPKCGSAEIQKRGFVHTNLGRYARIRCNECTGWSRGRDNLHSKEKRKGLLS